MQKRKQSPPETGECFHHVCELRSQKTGERERRCQSAERWRQVASMCRCVSSEKSRHVWVSRLSLSPPTIVTLSAGCSGPSGEGWCSLLSPHPLYIRVRRPYTTSIKQGKAFCSWECRGVIHHHTVIPAFFKADFKVITGDHMSWAQVRRVSEHGVRCRVEDEMWLSLWLGFLLF